MDFIDDYLPEHFSQSDLLCFDDLHQLLGQIVDTGVSDLHLHAWWPPYQRDPNGELCNVEETPARVVPESELFRLAHWVCRGTPHVRTLAAIEQQSHRLRERYLETGESVFDSSADAESFEWIRPEAIDAAVETTSETGVTGRFRVQIFFTEPEQPFEAGLNMAFRRIVPELPSYIDLGFTPAAGQLVSDIVAQKITSGLILVVGATGAGKSTTVAAMIEAVNQHLSVNITTIEDPVEFKFKNKAAFIRQIDLQKHTTSCAAALRNVLRQDPDIIVIQEIRDDETAQLALNLAQTNHLVIATLHGLTDSPSALLRFVAMTGNNFAAAATHTQAVIAQQLLAPKDRRSKRVLIQEVMRPRQNPEIKKLLREHSTEVEAYDEAIGKFNSVTNLEVRYVTSLFQALKNNEIAAAKAFAATRHEEELLELYRTVRLEASSTVGMPSFLIKRDGTGNTAKPLEA